MDKTNTKEVADNDFDNEEPIVEKKQAKTSQNEKVLRVSRVKQFGKQFLTYVVEGQAERAGVEMIPSYRRYRNDAGEEVEDRSMIVARKPKYTIPFTKETADKLIKQCEKSSEEPSFTFKQGGMVITIRNPENFVADFDEVCKKARAGTPV